MFGNLKTFRLGLIALMLFFVGSLSAQSLKGNVKDSTGEPIIGATIQEKGAKNMAVTDLDGNFSIKLSGGKQPPGNAPLPRQRASAPRHRLC